MMLGYLAFCLAAGVLWADAGGQTIVSALPLAASACIAVAFFLASSGGATRVTASIRNPSRDSSETARDRDGEAAGSCRAGHTSLSRGLGYLLAGAIAFDAGSAAMAEGLREAARDRQRAVETGQQGIRLVEARVVGRRTRSWGSEVDLSQAVAADGGTPLPTRLILRVPGDPKNTAAFMSRADAVLWPGAYVRLALRIQPIHAQRNPGSIDREREWARRGIAARARLVDPNWVVSRSDPSDLRSHVARRLGRWRDDWRQATGASLASSGDVSGIARALSLGDREGLAPDIVDDFRALGLSHLLAISGLHIGMVAGLLGWLTLRILVRVVPKLMDPFPWVCGIAVLGAGAYAWLVGGSVSVERAWCVLLVLGLFAIARRSPHPIEILSGIAIVLWIREPSMLFDLGAQLSFSACLGLVAAGVWHGSTGEGRRESNDPRIEARSSVGRLQENLGWSVRASCAAGFGTAGVLASHGLSTAWLAPLVNALAVPWTALVVLPASLGAALLAFLSVMGPGLDSAAGTGVKHAVTGLLWPAVGLVEAAAWCTAHLPRSLPLELGSPLLVGVATVLGLAALRMGRLRAALLCWALLAIAGGVSPAAHGVLDTVPRVWFFDVGQGDAALVEGRSGSILIDAGPGAPDGSGGHALVRSLRALGKNEIDLFVVTHADLDHRGGALRVLESLSVAELWLPESGRGDSVLDRLVESARAHGTRVSWRARETAPEYLGDLRIETLWPPRDRVERSRNDGSLVLRVGVGGRSILFLADVDAAIERSLAREDPERVRADYLKVSHHGSRGGTRATFLTHVGADHAFVSAPCRRGRGLPSPETLDRVRGSGTRLWWTGRDGALAVFPERFETRNEVVAWASPRMC